MSNLQPEIWKEMFKMSQKLSASIVCTLSGFLMPVLNLGPGTWVQNQGKILINNIDNNEWSDSIILFIFHLNCTFCPFYCKAKPRQPDSDVPCLVDYAWFVMLTNFIIVINKILDYPKVALSQYLVLIWMQKKIKGTAWKMFEADI